MNRHLLTSLICLQFFSVLSLGQGIYCVDGLNENRPCAGDCTCGTGVTGGPSRTTEQHDISITISAGHYAELTFRDPLCSGTGEQLENADFFEVTILGVSGTYECTCANGCCPISCTTTCGTNGKSADDAPNSGSYTIPSISSCFANEGTTDITLDITLRINANRLDECVEFSFTETSITGSPPPGCTLLASQILRIDAHLREATQEVDISWQTTASQAIHRYVVERSFNGSIFEEIGFVYPENQTDQAFYQFTDPSPLLGTNYYRIREEFYDDDPAYSFIRVVDNLSQELISVVNPTHHVLDIHFQHGLPPTLKSVDLTGPLGQHISSWTTFVEKQHRWSIPLQELPPGMYFLVFNLGNQLITKKIWIS